MSHFFCLLQIFRNGALDATNILWKVKFVLDTILYLRLKADTILTSLSQIAQNRVKVATDANIFEDRTFFEVPLKNFLLTS